MKILVVGGAGLIGGDAAILLASQGHDVAIAARTPPPAETPMARMPFLKGSYIDNDFAPADLARFDAIVFAAAHDPRNLPKGDDEAIYWRRVNTEAVPRFFETARKAGVGTAINVGSFYPWASPHLVAGSHYIQSRLDTDTALRALAAPGFRVVTINPPSMIGAVEGLGPRPFVRLVRYAEGANPEIPIYAPPGGTNYMSTYALAVAIAGALERGESGKAYLVGGENLSFKDYVTLYFRALGKNDDIPLIERPHPLLNSFAGYGGFIHYEVDPAETALLGYRGDDIAETVAKIVKQYRRAS